jgi:hypothetical protein
MKVTVTLPDTMSIVAMALAINSGGALSAYQTIPPADGGGDAGRHAQGRRDPLSATGGGGVTAEAMRRGCHQDRGHRIAHGLAASRSTVTR